MNLTLGSVVPLAMFDFLSRRLNHARPRIDPCATTLLAEKKALRISLPLLQMYAFYLLGGRSIYYI